MKGSSGCLSNCCCLPTLTCTSLHVVTIPVPWGHISGKSWGDEVSERKILCIHGETGLCVWVRGVGGGLEVRRMVWNMQTVAVVS